MPCDNFKSPCDNHCSDCSCFEGKPVPEKVCGLCGEFKEKIVVGITVPWKCADRVKCEERCAKKETKISAHHERWNKFPRLN